MSDLPSTPRIRLRRLTEDDLDLLCGLDADDGVLSYISRLPLTREEQKVKLDNAIAAYARWPRHGKFAAHDRSGAFLGWFSLGVRDDPSSPELGYRLHRRFWGRGLATEGGIALIDHAFEHLDAERVFATTMAVNAASRRVMEKCGLTYVRTFHTHFVDPLPGTEHGEVEYAVTHEEWRARGNADTR